MTQPDDRTVENELEVFLRCQFPAATRHGIDPHADLFDTGIIDSVGVTETLAHIEATYGIHIPDATLLSTRFTTLAGIAAVIMDLQAAHSP